MMSTRVKSFVIPGYLFLAILFGGASNGGFLLNAILQAVGIGLIVWAFWKGRRPAATLDARPITWLLFAASLLVAAQFLPAPVTLWELSAGRAEILREGEVVGLSPSILFLGLLPFEALKSALWLLPAVAIVFAMMRLPYWEAQHIAWAIVVAIVLSVVLGAIQVAQGSSSPAYFYSITNRGSTVGFFANSNHLATLLLISLPMIAALTHQQIRREEHKSREVVWTGAAAFLVVALAGIAVNGSLAGFGLVVPTVLASSAILIQRASARLFVLCLALSLVTIGLALLLFTPTGNNLLEIGDPLSSTSAREVIWANVWRAIADFMPFGSGLGTFEEVYKRYEDPTEVMPKYINHAHNDYLELLLEFGILIVPLLVAFFFWVGRRIAVIWSARTRQPFAMAASIAISTVLVHSIVDYPLRTAAISCIFAACLVMLSINSREGGKGKRRRSKSAEN